MAMTFYEKCRAIDEWGKQIVEAGFKGQPLPRLVLDRPDTPSNVADQGSANREQGE